jgi:branched-chain amino acid transport system permease protein
MHVILQELVRRSVVARRRTTLSHADPSRQNPVLVIDSGWSAAAAMLQSHNDVQGGYHAAIACPTGLPGCGRRRLDPRSRDRRRAVEPLRLKASGPGSRMGVPLELLMNAVIAGLLLGGLYAAVTAGVSISFGILDIVNIAHPAFIILGSYIAYVVNQTFGFDPILTSIVMLPPFYLLGALVYQIYYVSFEKRGDEALRGLAFFFGLLFITEVGLVLVFGVDYRYVEAPYIGPSLHLGIVALPLRMLVPCLVSLLLIALLQLFLGRTFVGRAIMAVSQDQLALRLMAADPIRIKRIAFAISIATAAVAGAFLIVIQPVEPSVGREYIGRVFAICVLGGMGSLPGTVIAAMLLGVVESITSTFYGPSWAPAVSFGVLLLTLAFRPAGLLGR